MEIELKYNIFKKELKVTLERAYTAFIHVNDIFSTNNKENNRESTPEELAEAKKIMEMMNGIDKSQVHKQIKG